MILIRKGYAVQSVDLDGPWSEGFNVTERDLIPIKDSAPILVPLPGHRGSNLDLIFVSSSLAHLASFCMTPTALIIYLWMLY